MKKVIKKIKLVIAAGKATPAPPVGTALGPAGVNIGEFVSRFNEATKGMIGDTVPVLLSVYEDRSFDFILKTPPTSSLILKTLKIEKGAGKPPSQKVGILTKSQLEEIAKKKMVDLNTNNLPAAAKIIAGTARSMGVEVR